MVRAKPFCTEFKRELEAKKILVKLCHMEGGKFVFREELRLSEVIPPWFYCGHKCLTAKSNSHFSFPNSILLLCNITTSLLETLIPWLKLYHSIPVLILLFTLVMADQLFPLGKFLKSYNVGPK